MRTREAVTISLPSSIAEEVEKLARKEEKNKSQLIRDALSLYVSEKKWRDYQKRITVQARALGIYTEGDVEKIIDEVRD